ncbi:MAG: ABC transporter permease [Oscillibacter sp.]|nr:ABC transporter permease [Oscillibacter sp.]
MDFFTLVSSFLAAALRQAAPLTLAGVGVAYSEKAGILNIGEEGIMLSGAFFGFMAAYSSGSLAIGLLGGIAGGLLIAMLHAFMCIHVCANQTIVGLALNYTTLGLTSFLFLLAFGRGSSLPSIDKLPAIRLPLLADIPVIGEPLFQQNILIYVTYLAVIVSCIVFYKTEWGISLTAVGENPVSADTAGLNVFGIRYLTCAINGVFGGLGGCYITLAQLGYFQEDIISGKGYIALVAVILGRRNPIAILLAAMVIGFAESLQFTLQAHGVPLPSQAFSMVPYLVAVLVLLFSIGKSSDPAALGRPYERDKR